MPVRQEHSVVYLNGEWVPRSEAKVSVEDRGFTFGDGVYEVWRFVQGRLFEHERHLARLHRGLRELRIQPPAEADGARVLEIAERLVAENGLASGEGTLYLEISRGAAPRRHEFPTTDTGATVFMMANPLVPPDALRATGATLVRVPDVRWHRCDIKTIQLLPNVMAKQRATEQGAFEAMLVRDGTVTEGSHSNIMGMLGGELRTHPANELILRGITRDVVLELAQAAGIRVNETAIPAASVPDLEELFLTATTADVMPVVRVGDTTIGNGAPGPIARQLYAALRALMPGDVSTAAR